MLPDSSLRELVPTCDHHAVLWHHPFLQEVNSPVMIQFSNGGGAFMAGKGLSNKDEKAAVAGSVAVSVMHTCTHTKVPDHPDHALHKVLAP